MANLKEIRTRIASVKSTKQITNAMKMVAASKLRKAQNAITQLRPYSSKLNEILSRLSNENLYDPNNVFAEKRKEEKILLITISSNRGLCGPFNTAMAKKTIELLTGQYKEQFQNGTLSIYTIGTKAGQILKSKGYKIAKDFSNIYEDLSFENTAQIAEELMANFKNGEFDKIEIVYNRFKNAVVQIPTQEQFLPIKQVDKKDTDKKVTEYIYEPNRQYIFQKLIPDSLKTQLFTTLTDSFAAEQGARMTAMHQATDNATEMIRELTITYNKARQATITKEINEITAGANALNG
ncbi:MAG: ATP synthase F1 subunit gamma [Bacteroidia bacterium]|nr:MAG: ATP synthase F1 subunit gamma [Bacteroidia bacterium]